ncbi:SDR family NAD(P)-dependent oxidoreductase [Nitrosopumilus piranensis]|uniref:SDR family NAD(P)-dependent oxidoreductase n=1 Tax=Nitrosopumilus piranensis TaxID=1582439 RepID=UPI0011E5A86D|nr:SDR family oxidoreductase [Nitrosopumilus piranensis]
MTQKKNMNFKGKNCLITGATGGLGTELSLLLAKMGFNLFLTSTRKSSLIKLEKKIQNFSNVRTSSFVADFTKNSDIQKLIKKIRHDFGTVDIIINNAAIFYPKSMLSSSLDDFEKSFSVNVKAPYVLCNKFGHDMKKNRWGRIVNIGSAAAYRGIENQSIYCSTKFALLGFSKSLVQEFSKYNVRVFFVAPGPLQTDMGKIVIKNNKQLNYDSFVTPTELSKFILDLIVYEKQLFVEEVRVGRIDF